jgi:hypothetical protein
MQTKTLNSSFLKEASYDNSKRTLTVSFKDGRSYSYQNVDRSVYQALITAESAGRFFGSNIRDNLQPLVESGS